MFRLHGGQFRDVQSYKSLNDSLRILSRYSYCSWAVRFGNKRLRFKYPTDKDLEEFEKKVDERNNFDLLILENLKLSENFLLAFRKIRTISEIRFSEGSTLEEGGKAHLSTLFTNHATERICFDKGKVEESILSLGKYFGSFDGMLVVRETFLSCCHKFRDVFTWSCIKSLHLKEVSFSSVYERSKFFAILAKTSKTIENLEIHAALDFKKGFGRQQVIKKEREKSIYPSFLKVSCPEDTINFPLMPFLLPESLNSIELLNVFIQKAAHLKKVVDHCSRFKYVMRSEASIFGVSDGTAAKEALELYGFK